MSPRWLSFAAGILALGLAACGGSRLKHLDADEFLEQGRRTQMAESMRWTTYVGSTYTNAYIEEGRLSSIGKKGKTTVFWTEVDGLPEDVAEKLRDGVDPWASEGKAR